jgi:hypothetical protein
MRNTIFQFIVRLALFTIIILVLTFSLNYMMPAAWLTPMMPFLVLFFAIVTAVVYYVIKKATAKRFNRFVLLFNLSTLVKLVIYIGVLSTYIVLFPNDRIQFLAAFFVLYICFTVFEIALLLRSEKK